MLQLTVEMGCVTIEQLILSFDLLDLKKIVKRKKKRFLIKSWRMLVMVLFLAGLIFVGVRNLWVKQSLVISRKKVVSGLRLARDYALTGQNPGGGGLGYVEVVVDENGVMEAWPNGVGSTYYSIDVSVGGVAIAVKDDNALLFGANDGRMLKDSEGLLVPFSTGETVEVGLVGGKGLGETQVVEIGSLGLIDEG